MLAYVDHPKNGNSRTHKLCPKCHVWFERWCYNNAYCRKCTYKWSVRYAQKKVGSILRHCTGCGREYYPTRRTEYASRYAGGRNHRFCSHECMDRFRAKSKDGLCVAPCIPKCEFPAGKGGLCQAHDQRERRGKRLDTPISKHQSMANAAARARKIAREKGEEIRSANRL